MSSVLDRIAAKRAELEELERLAQSEIKKAITKEDSMSKDESEPKVQRGGRKLRRTVHPNSMDSAILPQNTATSVDSDVTSNHNAALESLEEDE